MVGHGVGARRNFWFPYHGHMTEDERLQAHLDLCEQVYLRLVAEGKWPLAPSMDSDDSDSCARVRETPPTP